MLTHFQAKLIWFIIRDKQMLDWIKWTSFELKDEYVKKIETRTRDKLIQYIHWYLNKCYKLANPSDRERLSTVNWLDLIPHFSVNLVKHERQVKKPVRSRKKIDATLQCQARTGKGTQCIRARRDSADYCKTHQYSLPHGRFDQPAPIKSKSSKRGRKKKNQKIWTFDELYKNDYIKTQPAKIEYDGRVIDVLVDEHMFIYDKDSYKIIAREVDNEIHWYTS